MEFEKGSKVCWDSDPSSDECIVFRGEVVKDEGGEYVEVKSEEYQKHLQSFWKIKKLIVDNHDIVKSKDTDVFAVRRGRLNRW